MDTINPVKRKLSELEIKMIGAQPEGFFFNGEPYTGFVVWEFNNIVGMEFEVKDGLKDGLQKDFLADGTVTHETKYKNSMEDGICKEYFQDGKLKEEMYFEMGDLIWSNVYDESGKLIERYEK